MGSSISAVDIILLLCFIPAVIGGIKTGFIKQVAALAALILGAWAAWYFSDFFAHNVNIWLETNRVLTQIIAFAAVFLVVILFVNMIGHAIHALINLVLLGWLDKLLGVFFAFLKYAFVLSMVIFLMESLNDLYPFLPMDTISQSKLYGVISSIAPTIFPFIEKLHETGKEVGTMLSYIQF
jgi:membrane protein required for colicin V production